MRLRERHYVNVGTNENTLILYSMSIRQSMQWLLFSAFQIYDVSICISSGFLTNARTYEQIWYFLMVIRPHERIFTKVSGNG